MIKVDKLIAEHRWRILTLWILIFTAVTIWLIIQTRNDSKDRLNEINKARVLSCKHARTDLQNLLNIVTAKAREKFTDEQKKQYNDLLEQFSPQRCVYNG